jgi:type IV pilus assembly protein PilO
MDIGQAISDLQGLDASDLKKIGTAPVAARVFVLALLFAAIVFAGIWFIVKPKFEQHDVIAAKESDLKTLFDQTQAKAANREAYVEQLSEMKRTFNVMLRQLPNKTDIESLLIDLSQTSVAAGLEVEFFKPGKEVAREFYVEYPIKISVTGNYHQFGNFVSGLAALPRIVTLHNIQITPSGEAKNSKTDGRKVQKLKMDLTATTYRYLDDDEA